MKEHQRVLVVIQSPETFEAVMPLLSRATLKVERIPSAPGALKVAGKSRYDLILAQHPLPDLGLKEFLSGLRRLRSRSKAAPVVLLTQPDCVDPVAGRPRSDRVEAISLEQPTTQILAAISKALGVAPRTAVRLLVQLRVKLVGGSFVLACQSKNLSESGLLLRTSRLLPVGSEVQFSFCLPDDQREIAGLARVVRHAGPEDHMEGMGLTFLRMESAARALLRDFLASESRAAATPVTQVAEPTHPPADAS